MALEHELGLKKGFTILPHEALLNVYHTASLLKKRADEFFRPFGLTDVQFNVMALLHHQKGTEEGLSQAELGRMMLVNRANITSLIDRMEKIGLVVRTAAADDRRFNIIKLTPKGEKLLAHTDQAYIREVKRVMDVLKQAEQKKLISMLEKIREKLGR